MVSAVLNHPGTTRDRRFAMAAHEMDPLSPPSPTDAPAADQLTATATAPPPPVVEPRRIIPVTLPAAPPPGLSATPDAMALLKALKRRWFLALMLGCMTAGLAAVAAWYLIPAKFLAVIVLHIDSKRQDGATMVTNPFWHSMLMKTTADRLKSKEILLKALKEDGVRNLGLIRKHPSTTAAVMWMEENLKVDYREGSELLTVQLVGEEPQDLVRITEAHTAAFLQTVNGEERRQRKDRLARIAKLLEEAREKLREKSNEKETLQKVRGKSPQTLQQEAIRNHLMLERAKENLSHYEFVLNTKNAKLAFLLRQKGDIGQLASAEVTLKQLYDAEPDLANRALKVKKMENTLDVLKNHPDDDPFVRRIRRDLEKEKKELDTETAKVRSELEGKDRKRREAVIDTAIVELKTEVAPLEGYIAKYQKDVESLSQSAAEIDLYSGKQQIIDAEIVQQEKSVGELHQAAQKAQVEAEAELPITRLGEAEWQPRDAKKRLLMLLFAPLAAFCGVVLAVSWWEFSARRIQGPDEVVAGLAIRVVGAVPELPDPRRLQAGGDPEAQEIYRHNLVESIDAIRTMLLRNAPTENLRAIMVTSAVGGEGKTTLASNLAMSLARAGRKTLLIDCDLRRPSAHQLFEQTLQPGFSEVVLREVDTAAAIRPTTTDANLFLLPAGHWDREVLQELAKSGMTDLFAQLRQEFDFVIVDSHPVLPATDSLLIGQHVDAVIVSLMRDISQVHHVHAACQQLSTLGIRVFGAVVNGVPVKVYGKGYQYTTQAAG
jgi:succinoglycan biosynthesis transport protein ExoP